MSDDVPATDVSFLIVTLLAVAIGATGIFSLMSAADNTALMAERTEIAIIAARLNRTIQAQRAAFRGAAVYQVMGMTEQRDSNIADLQTLETDYDTLHGQVADMLQTETGIRLMSEIDAAYKPFSEARDVFEEDIIDPNISNEAMVAQLDVVAETVAPLANSVAALVDFADTLTSDMAIEAEATASRTTVIMVVVLIIVAAIAMFLAFYISGLISKPLKDMMGYIKQAGETGNLHFRDDEWANCDRLSQGKDEIGQTMNAFTRMMRKFVYYGETVDLVAHRDLTVAVDTMGPDDTFGNAIAGMVDNLNDMFAEIKVASAQVATGSTQIADGAQALAQGSTEQAATVQELSASISEIAEKTHENAVMASDAAKLANTIMDNAEKGSQQMNEMTTAVNEINMASQDIGRVIKSIEDIAFQTNILALNAAVEAARAGQHGRGFAVVADEVRNLAAKSAEAAKDTGVLISNSIVKAQLGAQIASDTASSLAEIVSGISESTQIVSKIATSSEEQNAGIKQINEGIDQVAQVVQQNSATAEQSAAASQQLSGQSTMLEQHIGQFKLRGQQTAALQTVQPIRRAASDTSSFALNNGSSGKY